MQVLQDILVLLSFPLLQFLLLGSLLKSQLEHLVFPISGYFLKDAYPHSSLLAV